MSTAWQFVTTHLEVGTLWASVVATAAGGVALLLVCFGWSWLGPHYREFWAKIVVAGFRLIAAGAAIAARVAPVKPDTPFFEQPWAGTVLIAGAGYLLWEVAGAYGDHRYKQAKESKAASHQAEIDGLNRTHAEEMVAANQEVDQANQDREDAEYQAMRLGWLLSHLRTLVHDKRQRVRRVAQATADARASIQRARDGLAPEEQVQILLEKLASLFRMQAVFQDGTRHDQNFRVGLFVEADGLLVPLAAFDLVTRSHEPFSSYAQHADRYRLDNVTSPSHAVRCLREGQTLIVSDCLAVPDFYFHDRQSTYLRSMIAHPIAGFCSDGVSPVRAALLIDTDVADFFHEDDREMLELLLREFVARIDLEYGIRGLTR